jgi:serine/threonine protein kinase
MTPESLCMGCMEERGSSDRCVHCGWEEGSPAESLLQLPPRTVLDGRYLIGRALGQGGFGITYLAWDLNLECKLAVKEYFPRDICTRARDECTVQPVTHGDRETFQEALKTFMEEGRALARFRDRPGVVSVLGFFQENGTAYIVMSYMEGLTLKQYLAERGGKIDFKTALSMLMPVMDTLKEVHASGMLHRDISPDNIYLTRNSQVKLLDFGNARFVLGERSRSLSAVLKPGYAPEEQFRRQGRQGPWTDVYALAATFYRVLTGLTPPEAPDRLAHDDLIPPSQLGVALPRRAEQALLKALAVRQEERFQSVADFQKDVNRLEPLPPPPSPPPPRPWKRYAFAAVITAIVALAGFWIIAHRPKTGRLTITANIVGAKISIDGRTQPDWLTPHRFDRLSAGPHLVTATKDGYQTASQKVNVPAGAHESLQVNLPSVPRPPPSSPQFGRLDIRANVVGAKISMDGGTQPDWLTPYRFNELSAGPHVVTATKDGYQTASQRVNVAAGADETLEVNLRPVVHPSPPPAQSGRLDVRANVAGATIRLDGRSESGWVTPHIFSGLPPSTYGITVRKAGYRSVTQSVTIVAGGASSINFNLKPWPPPFGSLTVTANVGGAKIMIDGRTQPGWLTPHTFGSVLAGSHSVTVVKDGFQPASRNFAIRRGAPISLNLTLSPNVGAGELVVTSNVPGARIVVDGTDTGFSAPHTFSGLSAGPHTVSVLKDSYDPAGGRFDIEAGKSVTANLLLSLPMQQLTLAVLEVSPSHPEGVPVLADVFIDGKSYGRSPVKTKLPPGVHHYQVITGSNSERGSFKIRSEFGTLELAVKILKN